jgi:hypothetical protein
MFGFDDHPYCARGEVTLEPSGHLGGETLLQLEIAGEELHHSGEL